MKKLLFIVLFIARVISGYAQSPVPAGTTTVSDTIPTVPGNAILTDTAKTDSAVALLDSATAKPTLDTAYYKLLRNPFLPSISDPLYLIINERKRESKDELFYIISGLMLFLAFLKFVFAKYFQNIFRLFFQPTFRQKQTREQLLQNNFPSLLYNLFFILSAGIYIALLIQHFYETSVSFLSIFVYSILFLTTLYFLKYIFLSFAGWVFNVKDASETYIFVVYLINKITGILLVPFILILAFSTPEIIQPAITVSILTVALLFTYRYVISFAPVRRDIKVSAWHFFFYICAFEVIPFLLIYKLLANYLHRSL